MSQPAKAHEPSMEEILASIRRIISDDETPKSDAATVPVPPQTLVTPRPATLPPRSPTPMPTVVRPPSIDQIGTAAVTAALETPPELEPDADPNPQNILDLTESMTAQQPEAAGFQTIDGQSDVVFTDPPSEPAPRAAQEPPRPQVTPPPLAAAEPPPPTDRTLMSPQTSAAVDSAFNALAQTVLVQNARTLEDLVKEMLRPMLKSWLDDNLPSVVERIVKAEIERVSRGRD
jgi:cell pole-organizing protein PopZ